MGLIPRRRAGDVLVAAAAACAGASRALHRVHAAADALLAGVLDATLLPEERTRLGIALYDASPRYRETQGLAPWEERWFDADLPAPPCRLLVGACGAGREVRALLDRGARVHAFDPTPSLVARARETCPEAEIEELTYERWTDRAASGAPGRFDAVLLGWGSLSHVLNPAARVALVQRLDALCPDGPLLVSYWPRARRGGGRARSAGVAAGAALSRLSHRAVVSSGDHFDPTIGFVHPFDDASLSALARAASRVVHRRGAPGDYPHATLTRSAHSPASEAVPHGPAAAAAHGR